MKINYYCSYRTSRESSHTARLQGRTVFRDVRDDAEQQIYEALKRKMDEFMELANYDWVLSEPSGQASSFLMDVIAFLHSTFQAFTNLKVTRNMFYPPPRLDQEDHLKRASPPGLMMIDGFSQTLT